MYKRTDMKRLLTLILGLGLAMASWAEEELKMYSHVYLKLHDGNTYEIPIEHGSKMHSYVVGAGRTAYHVVDITGTDCFYQFRRDEIAVMKLVEDATGIEFVEYDSNDAHASMLYFKDGKLYIHHMLEGATLWVYNLSGQLMTTQRVEDDCTIDLSDLDEGVYVAKVNEHTLKIKK